MGEAQVCQGINSADYYRKRSLFLRNADRYRCENKLGPEFTTVSKLILNSTPWAPWGFVQIGDQEDMAVRLGMSRRTLQRHLRHLKAAGILLGRMGRFPDGPRYLSTTTAYPFFQVAPEVVEEVLNWHTGRVFKSVLQKLERDTQLALDKRQSGAYQGDPEDRVEPENPCNSKGSSSDTEMSTDPLNINISTSTDQIIHHVWPRLRRSRVKEAEMINRWTPEEDDAPVLGKSEEALPSSSSPRRKQQGTDDSPVLGKDPNAPRSKPRPTTAASRVANAFEDHWRRVRSGHRGLAPILPYHPGAKTAFMGWISNTLLPAFDYDENFAITAFAKFCDLAFGGREYYDEDLPYPVWSQFWHSSQKLRVMLSAEGVLPAEEALKLEEERQAEDERRHKIHEEMRQLREREKAAPTPKTRLVPADEMEWTLD